MKYRPIPAIPIENLPDHINLLRNLQDMHQVLLRLPETFPVLELGDIVPNYEGQASDFIHRGKRILAKFDIETDLWDQKIEIDISVYGMAAHQLVARKFALVDKLEQMIDRWQVCVDKIEAPDKSMKCDRCGKKLSEKWVLSSYGSFCSMECANKGPRNFSEFEE